MDSRVFLLIFFLYIIKNDVLLSDVSHLSKNNCLLITRLYKSCLDLYSRSCEGVGIRHDHAKGDGFDSRSVLELFVVKISLISLRISIFVPAI